MQWSGWPAPVPLPTEWDEISYTYDAAGRRIEKKYDGWVVVKYLYDGDHCLAEHVIASAARQSDGNNNLLRKYIFGPGVDEPVSMIDVEHSNATYYYHFDALGSVIALSDADGNTAELYEYSVYGQVAASDANNPNRFMFTGREFDKETGLYYYRARYYHPEIGRFLQTDPIGYGDGMNVYQYCANSPVVAMDPYGLSYVDLIATGHALYGFAWDGGSGSWYGLYSTPAGATWTKAGVSNAVLHTHPDAIDTTTGPGGLPIFSSDGSSVEYSGIPDVQQGYFEQLTAEEVADFGLQEPGAPSTEHPDAAYYMPGSKPTHERHKSPDPGPGWRWNPAGYYEKGGERKHWHPEDPRHRPHWDVEDRKGNKIGEEYPPPGRVVGIITAAGAVVDAASEAASDAIRDVRDAANSGSVPQVIWAGAFAVVVIGGCALIIAF